MEFTKSLARFTVTDNKAEMMELQLSVDMDRAVRGVAIKQMVKSGQVKLSEAITVLAGLILSTGRFFNLGMNINQEQAIETAMLLLEKYGYESMQDFVLMFKHAKMGNYGKTFNRIDGQIIFEWMGQYMEEKAAHRERLHRKRKNTGNLGFSIGEMIKDTREGEKTPENGGKPVNPGVKRVGVIGGNNIPGLLALKAAIFHSDPDKAIKFLSEGETMPDLIKMDQDTYNKFKQDYIIKKNKH